MTLTTLDVDKFEHRAGFICCTMDMRRKGNINEREKIVYEGDRAKAMSKADCSVITSTPSGSYTSPVKSGS